MNDWKFEDDEEGKDFKPDWLSEPWATPYELKQHTDPMSGNVMLLLTTRKIGAQYGISQYAMSEADRQGYPLVESTVDHLTNSVKKRIVEKFGLDVLLVRKLIRRAHKELNGSDRATVLAFLMGDN